MRRRADFLALFSIQFPHAELRRPWPLVFLRSRPVPIMPLLVRRGVRSRVERLEFVG